LKVSSKENVKPFKILPKVYGRVSMSGKNIMILLVEIKPNGVIPEHSHLNEQMGICLKGKAEFNSNGKKQMISPGIVYYFPSNETHSIKLIGNEVGVFLDIFSSPREDYIKRQKGFIKL